MSAAPGRGLPPASVTCLGACAALLALLFALAFIFSYPAFVTYHAKGQSGFRFQYILAGWSETASQTWSNALAYHGALSILLLERLKEWRTGVPPPGERPWDLHPLEALCAALVAVVGAVVLAVALLLLALIKVLPMLVRAYLNHVRATPAWAPVPGMKRFVCLYALGYWATYVAIPVAAALFVVAAPFYGVFAACTAAGIAFNARGNPRPAVAHMGEVLQKVRRGGAGGHAKLVHAVTRCHRRRSTRRRRATSSATTSPSSSCPRATPCPPRGSPSACSSDSSPLSQSSCPCASLRSSASSPSS